MLLASAFWPARAETIAPRARRVLDVKTGRLLEDAAELALRGARNARKTLLAGFTTVRDVGAWDFTDLALARAVERKFIDGPRIIASGHALGSTGGHCDVTGFSPGIREMGPEEGIADGEAEILKGDEGAHAGERPRQDISAPQDMRFVMIGGRVIKGPNSGR